MLFLYSVLDEKEAKGEEIIAAKENRQGNDPDNYMCTH